MRDENENCEDYLGRLHRVLEPFVSKELQVISCLGALDILIAGSELDRSSMADVETWLKAQTLRALHGG